MGTNLPQHTPRETKKPKLITLIIFLILFILFCVFMVLKTNAFEVKGVGIGQEQKPMLWMGEETFQEVMREEQMEVSAYSPRIEETDSTPLITASNKKVQENYVANNCLPFGTKLKIDGREYEVQDRMNRRYGCDHLDLFMWDTYEALKFGRQIKQVEIKIFFKN